ncbi:MAG: PQQ-dependent sugar dehydrogenase [Pseudomonadota bacterium]
MKRSFAFLLRRAIGRLAGLLLSTAVLLTPAAAAAMETLASGLDYPWALAFLPNGDVLITERSGQLKRLQPDGSLSTVDGVPPVYFAGQGGLMDVVLHPAFADNGELYLTLAHGTPEANATRVVRARLSGNALENVRAIFTAAPLKDTPVHYGGRLAFLDDGTLLITTGDGFNYREAAQDLTSLLGKTVRLNDDGSIPADNPFVGDATAEDAIYSFGHRNPQGLLVTSDGRILLHEHGPRGGDEINLLKPGANYGWPATTYGTDYTGAAVSPFRALAGVSEPHMVWVPSIAPAGFTIVTSERFADWRGDLLVGALVNQQVRRVELGADWQSSQDHAAFPELSARIREVREGPEGCLYVLTDGPGGSLVRFCSNVAS